MIVFGIHHYEAKLRIKHNNAQLDQDTILEYYNQNVSLQNKIIELDQYNTILQSRIDQIREEMIEIRSKGYTSQSPHQ
jgi:hypothetical protein